MDFPKTIRKPYASRRSTSTLKHSAPRRFSAIFHRDEEAQAVNALGELIISRGAIAAARTMGARCSRSGSWRRSDRR
jgi:hypothetical protein